ncbi:hypothetical protein Aduo_002220 [Ancylostoma duodenale]
MPSSELECCLHGRVCRAGLKQAEEKEETEQYVNLMQSKGQKKKSRKEEAIDRLAKHLIHVEEHAERRQKRREKRAKRRSRREKEKAEGFSNDAQSLQKEIKETIISNDLSTKSFKQVTESAGDNCCRINRTVSVRLSPPKREKYIESSSAAESSEVTKEQERRTHAIKDNAGDSHADMARERRGCGHEHEKKIQDDIESRNFQTGDTEVNRGSYEGAARGIYLGICNFSKAEESVKKRADFKLYHEMVHRPLLDDLEPELPLFLVYKTANGSYRHYRICTRTVHDSTYYIVDTGEKKPIHHISLDHLVRYYQVFIYGVIRNILGTTYERHTNQIHAQRHPEHHEYADPFPWWEVQA